MKTLSQIPRNISTKFCFQIDKMGGVESNEVQKSSVPYTFEDSNDVADNSPKLTEEQQSKIDAQELSKIEVKLNLKDSALVNNDEALKDLAADIPTKTVDKSLFRKFIRSSNAELKSNYAGADVKNLIDNIEDDERGLGLKYAA